MESFMSYPYSLGVGVLGVGGLLLFAKRYFGGGVCRSQAVLTGKTAIVTGANTGIGLETAVDLARRDARVILACRSVEKGEKAAVQVRKRSGNQNVLFVHLDLSSMDSVRAFARKILEEEPRIDILVNNAGVFNSSFQKTQDGFESVIAINHLGPFLLTNLLLDRIKQSPSARIVNVSSKGYLYGKIDFDTLNSPESFSSIVRYNQSKLANVIFTRCLAEKLRGTGVLVNAAHPGVARTEIARGYNAALAWSFWTLAYLFTKSPWEGAQTSIHCAVSEDVEGKSGEWFIDCQVSKMANPLVFDEALAARLWQVSAQLVGLKESMAD